MLHLPRMRKYILAIAITISSNFSFACGNEYYRTEMPLEKGNLNIQFLLKYENGEKMPYWIHGFNNDGGIRVDPLSLLNEYNKTKNYKYLSDYAWELVKRKETKQAITILDSLLKTHPNEYNILANLGTAYEIAGNNSKALEILTKAVAINKNSHYGSEWIHLNILKHKINKEAFPIEKIIGLGIDDYNSQWNTATWAHPIPADSLLKSIAYQLHERIRFIAPKDKIIGRLIFDFAAIISKTKSKEEALPFFDYAMYYDNELYKYVVKAKAEEPKERSTTTEIESTLSNSSRFVLFTFISIVLLLGSFMIGRKSKKS